MLKITKTDSKKEREGIWTDYYGVELKIARFRSENLMKRLKMSGKKRRSIPNLITIMTDELAIKWLSEEILVDWRKFPNGEGGEVPYTPENSFELLLNDPDCRDFVSDFSTEIDNYMSDGEDDLLGK